MCRLISVSEITSALVRLHRCFGVSGKDSFLPIFSNQTLNLIDLCTFLIGPNNCGRLAGFEVILLVLLFGSVNTSQMSGQFCLIAYLLTRSLPYWLVFG